MNAKHILPLLTVIAICGCALTPQQAADMPTYNLCRVATAPMSSEDRIASAMNEVRRRNESCDKYAAEIQRQRSAESSALMYQGVELQRIGQPRVLYQPQPAPMVSQPVRTTCRNVFNEVHCETW